MRKIKSKTFHRLLKKSEARKRTKLDLTGEIDPEEAKEEAIKQEFKRAQVLFFQRSHHSPPLFPFLFFISFFICWVMMCVGAQFHGEVISVIFFQ